MLSEPSPLHCSSVFQFFSACLGRNELIARYIKLRTGKTRTRKQVFFNIRIFYEFTLRKVWMHLEVDKGQPTYD